jgi:hypothetical protein
MKKTLVPAAALGLLLAASLPAGGSQKDCRNLSEAQVYAKSKKVLYDGAKAVTYKVCVCDNEPTVEVYADGKPVGIATSQACLEATGTRIEVHASPDRGATIGYTQILSSR